MKRHSKLQRTGLLVVILLLGAAAWAQDTASITGTVTDSSGAAVPNAQVAVTNAEHGINGASATNGSGEYLFASLPIGSYDLTVTAEGFKKYEAKGVVLRVAEKARVNVALQVGTISTEVVVEGSEVAQVETQSSDLGNTVSGKEITQLELNGRDFTQLVALSPGVTNQSGQDEGGAGATTVAFSINGGRTEYNNFEIDGGDALDNGSNYHAERLSQHRCHCGSQGADFQLRGAIWPERLRHGRSGNQVRHQSVPRRLVRVHAQRRFQCDSSS